MRTLLLNTGGEFLSVIDWQDAIGDLVVGNVRSLRDYDKTVRSQYLELRIPAVVEEVRRVNVKFEHIFRITHSTKNIFIRDHYICQYCGFECSRTKYSQHELQKRPSLYRILPEMDHVIPQSRGGPNTWENTVTSCRKCNNQKDSQRLEDVDMKLRSIPRRPQGFKEIFEMKIGQIHELWMDYLQIYF